MPRPILTIIWCRWRESLLRCCRSWGDFALKPRAERRPPSMAPNAESEIQRRQEQSIAKGCSPVLAKSQERVSSMAVHIPPILVVIACKVVMAGNPDPNAAFTDVENTDWATENSMMVCQRHEVDLYDPVEGMQLNPSDQPVPALNPNFADHGQCASRRHRSLRSTGIRRTATLPGACGASAARRRSSISGAER